MEPLMPVQGLPGQATANAVQQQERGLPQTSHQGQVVGATRSGQSLAGKGFFPDETPSAMSESSRRLSQKQMLAPCFLYSLQNLLLACDLQLAACPSPASCPTDSRLELL
ncbi:uncharacterized protein LOC144582520 isoform X2 [Callithrix jacchus]